MEEKNKMIDLLKKWDRVSQQVEWVNVNKSRSYTCIYT